MNKSHNETEILSSVIQSNESYSESFNKGDLAIFPSKKFAILTCMDARLDPAKFSGLAEGDAHVIRNAGGRASDDAIRSLVISHKLLATVEWFVIHHTNCGMELFTDDIIGDLLDEDLETATFNGENWNNEKREKSENTKPSSNSGKYIKWHTINDLKQSVIDDVNKIKNHDLVPSHIKIYGFIYDVKTGKLIPVK